MKEERSLHFAGPLNLHARVDDAHDYLHAQLFYVEYAALLMRVSQIPF